MPNITETKNILTGIIAGTIEGQVVEYYKNEIAHTWEIIGNETTNTVVVSLYFKNWVVSTGDIIFGHHVKHEGKWYYEKLDKTDYYADPYRLADILRRVVRISKNPNYIPNIANQVMA